MIIVTAVGEVQISVEHHEHLVHINICSGSLLLRQFSYFLGFWCVPKEASTSFQKEHLVMLSSCLEKLGLQQSCFYVKGCKWLHATYLKPLTTKLTSIMRIKLNPKLAQLAFSCQIKFRYMADEVGGSFLSRLPCMNLATMRLIQADKDPHFAKWMRHTVNDMACDLPWSRECGWILSLWSSP